jgi:hypothetical protein
MLDGFAGLLSGSARRTSIVAGLDPHNYEKETVYILDVRPDLCQGYAPNGKSLP